MITHRHFSAGKLAALVSLSAFAAVSTHAATIVWGSATNISGDSDVSTAGSLFFSANIGNASASGANSIWGPASAAVVNGVSFTGAYLNTMTTSGSPPVSSKALFSPISVNNAANGLTIQGTANTTFGTGTPYSNLSTNYRLLLGQGAFTSTGVSTTLTLSSLTAGNTYYFQWWTNDSRTGSASGRTVTATTGSSFVTLDSNTSAANTVGLGQFSIGSFVADATSQAIVFTGTAGVQISAFQVRDLGVVAVPEPSSFAALAGLGALGFVALRRRRAA